MQGNKKPIFFYESHHKATDLQKKGLTNLYCLKSGAAKYKKFENVKKNQDKEALHFWKPVTIEPQ